jgi:hypothetical protein
MCIESFVDFVADAFDIHHKPEVVGNCVRECFQLGGLTESQAVRILQILGETDPRIRGRERQLLLR